MALSRDQIVKRVALELRDGYYVNLGIGIPTLVANYVPAGVDVILQSENGLLGIGPFPTEAEVDPDLINAGKQTVTAITGASYFGSHESFAMIRGKKVKGMGGAMDLVAGARRVIVTMDHCNKDGEHKLLKQCRLPLTGKRVVHELITDLGYFSLGPEGCTLLEIAPGVTIADIREKSECEIRVRDGELPVIAT
jgi:3-oxoacid CoA-transferase subunit B